MAIVGWLGGLQCPDSCGVGINICTERISRCGGCDINVTNFGARIDSASEGVVSEGYADHFDIADRAVGSLNAASDGRIAIGCTGDFCRNVSNVLISEDRCIETILTTYDIDIINATSGGSE